MQPRLLLSITLVSHIEQREEGVVISSDVDCVCRQAA